MTYSREHSVSWASEVRLLVGVRDFYWCRIHLWFRLMGGLQAKSMTSQSNRATYKMADMCYYGNIRTTTRWRLYVTMETLWQQQDGGYALLWKRYPNIHITSTFAVEDVYTELVIDVFYIFNSTVIDWTCYYCHTLQFLSWRLHSQKYDAVIIGNYWPTFRSSLLPPTAVLTYTLD